MQAGSAVAAVDDGWMVKEREAGDENTDTREIESITGDSTEETTEDTTEDTMEETTEDTTEDTMEETAEDTTEETTEESTKGITEPASKPMVSKLEASWSNVERDPIILRYTIENEWDYVKIYVRNFSVNNLFTLSLCNIASGLQ